MLTPVRRLGVVLVTGLAVVAALVPATGGGATAQVAAHRTSGHGAAVVESPTAATSARALRDYWTPARMDAAVPVDRLLGLSGPDRTATTTAARKRVHVPTSVGKLFFTTSAGDASCSAAAIRTRKKNQVITAGHCVHTGPDGIGLLGQPEWFRNWVFVPKYRRGRHPLGRWSSTKAYAFRAWVRNGRFTRDQAIIKFAKHNGHKLVPRVGGNRVHVASGVRHRGVRIWGWPAEGRYNGEVAVHCDGRTTRRGRSPDMKMRCPMNGGASGGPWLQKKGRHRNTGVIIAVTSRRTVHQKPRYLLAVPLPRAVRSMIRQIN